MQFLTYSLLLCLPALTYAQNFMDNCCGTSIEQDSPGETYRLQATCLTPQYGDYAISQLDLDTCLSDYNGILMSSEKSVDASHHAANDQH